MAIHTHPTGTRLRSGSCEHTNYLTIAEIGDTQKKEGCFFRAKVGASLTSVPANYPRFFWVPQKIREGPSNTVNTFPNVYTMTSYEKPTTNAAAGKYSGFAWIEFVVR